MNNHRRRLPCPTSGHSRRSPFAAASNRRRGVVGTAIGLTCGAVALAGCGGGAVSNNNAPVLAVVTGLAPFAQAAAAIGQGKVQVIDVVPDGADPLTYQLTPTDIGEVRSAGLALEVGDSFQPSFEAAASGAQRVFDLRRSGSYADPYVWLDPNMMESAVAAIAKAMEAADPGAASVFRSGATGFESEVASDSSDYQSTLSTCAKTAIFTIDGAFSAMAADYGLKDHVISGVSLNTLRSEVSQANVSTVFTEPWLSQAGVESLARATGTKVKSLDTLLGPPSGGWQITGYSNLVESNLGVLNSALDCNGSGTES